MRGRRRSSAAALGRPCRADGGRTWPDTSGYRARTARPGRGQRPSILRVCLEKVPKGSAAECGYALLRIEFRIPVEVVEPAVVQVVGRKQPAVAMQVVHGRLER